MSGTRPRLRPEPGERGLASADGATTAALVGACWDGLTALAASRPLGAPSRLPGWTVRDVLVHLGSWPEHRRFASLLDDARNDRPHHLDDVDARNAALTTAHSDADATELAEALTRARDDATAFLASPEATQVGPRMTTSALGALPVGGVVVAACHDLAVHALDITRPDAVPAGVLDAGVAALVDTVGALCARAGLDATFAIFTPGSRWAVGTSLGCWTTVRIGPELAARELAWPCVEGAAHDVLDASSGRGSALQLLLSRRLRAHDVPALLDLIPALQDAPGVPSSAALRAAAVAAAGAGRLVGRIGGLVGRG